MPWIQSISNHLWWCAATCDGDVVLLREKWKSVLHHIVNKHKWTGNTFFHQCGHRRIPSSEARNICWLKPGLPVHLASEEVVLNTKLLKDLAKLTDFCHTGKIEVYHSMMLKYCWKQEHISYKGMVARTQLAVLDNNANAETTSFGEVRWTCWSRKKQGLLPKGSQTLGCEACKSKKILPVLVNLAYTSSWVLWNW